MELMIPAFVRQSNDQAGARPVSRPTKTLPAFTVQPDRRAFSRLFRRESTPSTFHRCLAVHMHFAQRSSALD
jgi:hypothetical protein